mgnify:CR=1 FL=1
MKTLGIIAAPAWFDPTLEEIAARHRDEIRLNQTILLPPKFDYSFQAIRESEPKLLTASQQLADAGCDLIIQVGPAFAYQIGGTPQGAREFGRRLSDGCGVPVILNGVAVLDLLEATEAQKLTLACPYYDPDWKAELSGFLLEAGYDILTFQTFVDQGLFDDQDTVNARGYQFSEQEVTESVRRSFSAAPESDAILVSGSGIRTLSWIKEMEQELGVPIVSADQSLYLGMVNAFGLQT